MADLFGLGWRPELAAGIFAHLDRIDVVEVIAEDYTDEKRVRALRTLAAQTPVVLHGIGLGAASCYPVQPKRLDRIARLVERIRPAFWSEHLAFVRGGGAEIGHLAAAPRTSATVEGAAENIDRARRIVGSTPLMENISTLVDPLGSDRDEATWTSQVLGASDCGLLLDLHNVHANALNFKWDASAFLERIPMERVGAIHLAGGRMISASSGERRLLDDHKHDVPDPVYELLSAVAERAPQPLTVILERDGDYPSMEDLLAQIDRARTAVAAGRARRRTP